MADARARRDAQRINTAHIAEHAAADMVQVIEFDDVSLALRLGVAPGPADRDRRVEEVSDVAVGDRVVARLADPDTDAARKDPDAAVDDAVVHGDPAGLVGGFRGDPSLTDPDAACAKIDQDAALDATVGAAMPEPDPVNPGVLDPEIRQGQVPGIVRHDHRGEDDRAAHWVGSHRDHDGDRPGPDLLFVPEGADPVACAFQRGQRTVGSSGVGTSQGAGPVVIAARGHMDRQSRRSAGKSGRLASRFAWEAGKLEGGGSTVGRKERRERFAWQEAPAGSHTAGDLFPMESR